MRINEREQEERDRGTEGWERERLEGEGRREEDSAEEAGLRESRRYGVLKRKSQEKLTTVPTDNKRILQLLGKSFTFYSQ